MRPMWWWRDAVHGVPHRNLAHTEYQRAQFIVAWQVAVTGWHCAGKNATVTR